VISNKELLNATWVIYLQYWLALEVETTFLGHLPIIHAHFGHPQGLGVF